MRYRSKQRVYYASETLIFEMRLKRAAEVADLSDTDIILEFTTGQLGPRRFAASYALSPEIITTSGVQITRTDTTYYLELSPEFLQTFPTGRLVITAHYRTLSGDITTRIPLRRFINDMPIPKFAISEQEAILVRQAVPGGTDTSTL